MAWTVYIIEASDTSLYTGISTDVERRWQQHLTGKAGAKFFRGRKPVRLLYQEAAANRSEASRREVQIKRLNRTEKWRLIQTAPFTASADWPASDDPVSENREPNV